MSGWFWRRAALLGLGILVVLALAQLGHAAAPTDARISSLIAAAWPGDSTVAECIAGRESTGTPGHYDPRAYSGGQYGLFQIAAQWHPGFDTARAYDPAYNIAYAHRIYLDALHRYGWRYRWSGPAGTLWTTAHGCGA